MRGWTIAMALMATACARAPDAAVPADPAALAATAGQQILAAAPKSLGGGVAITGAKAEGRVLVIAIGGMTDWRRDYSDAAMATTMKRAICFEPGVEPLLAAGGRVRLESRTPAGQNLPPLTIERC